MAESPSSAVVFPGMAGSAFTDVGRFMLLNPFARRRLAAADEVLGYSVLARLRESEQDYTEAARVAFLVNSLALADLAAERLGMTPSLCVGASFGQQAAAAYTDALSFADSIRLAVGVARIEDEYFATEHTDVVTHSFTRTPREKLDGMLAELGAWHEVSAQLDDGFYMISLRRNDLDGLKDRIRDAGGYSLYTMWPPVHASVFTGLRERIEAEVVGELTFADPALPIVSDQDGSVLGDAAGVRDLVLGGVVRPIRWDAVLESLRDNGIGTVYVPGPENLFARLRGMGKAFKTVAVTPKSALRAKPGRLLAVAGT
ncbi:ACP S-malonyltransferase [Amycolatopsis sp. CA-230715]|uniref:ACP S-malonyltransferase n=1 Tax=Amycolatopsis sp. CA-230715 TaxID=2745196 RepID=UPI001C32B715|nr:ACP S-malonyltransferase [Amycolatopsis sp. CA-230715]QWF78543.1 hypothetical protein HUW46_01939 [Amycolatopsis sp. CA-230715]